MRYAFIASQRVAYPIAVLCRVMQVSRSGFYDFVGDKESDRERRDARLTATSKAVFEQHKGRYGSPRVCIELRARGEQVGKKKVAQIMRENGLVARKKRRFQATTDSKHEDPIAQNLLERNFRTKRPDDVWVTDVTAIWTRSGWLYLAVMLDLFSRRVVGFATSANNDRFLALDALRSALIARRPQPGLIHHSDRGSPYASKDYREALLVAGAVASMSRKGDCWDNAVAESFFATLKTEAFNGDPESHDDAILAITNYIDSYYNTKRRHSYLGFVSPIEFELKSQRTAMAA